MNKSRSKSYTSSKHHKSVDSKLETNRYTKLTIPKMNHSHTKQLISRLS